MLPLKCSILPIVINFCSLGLTAHAGTCKCSPNDLCWPSSEDWGSLNSTIDGKLVAGQPAAAVCYPGAQYNATLCGLVSAQWTNSSFHASDPISTDYPFWSNNSCNPIFPNGTSVTGDPSQGTKGCSLGRYPSYVVNATSAEQISKAIKFANDKNIRLVIKNTGHNAPGRNLGFGSLSIWTHNLKSMTWQPDFQPANCTSNGTQPGMLIGAGIQDFELYAAGEAHNATLVGGSNPTVGVVGWFQGGGHGPLSSTFGMGADNVLEATIMTPTGEIVVANECNHPDLFWAVRGGGGGTFGVIVSAVLKAHPAVQATLLTLAVTVTNPNATDLVRRWYKLMAEVHADMPRLKAGGAQGYYGISGPPLSEGLTFSWGMYHYDKSNATVQELYAPTFKLLNDSADFVQYQSTLTSAPSFSRIWAPGEEPVANVGFAMGSRLLTEQALNDTDALAAALEKIGPTNAVTNDPLKSPPSLLGHFIANNANRDLDIAMNPVWRDTVSHFIIVEGYLDSATPEQVQAIRDDVTYIKDYELRKLTPDGGAYFNEADPFEPNWQWAFFNKNYPRLKAIKKSCDPNSVLWCRSCVGSEEWTEQQDGTLCKAGWAQ